MHPSNPVPEDRIGELAELLRWIYGSKEDKLAPVILSQNPDIKRLGEVLDSTEALAVLRTDRSLVAAHASTQQAGQRFLDSLVSARREIREATNNLRGFDGRDSSLINIAEDITESAMALLGRMKKKFSDTPLGD